MGEISTHEKILEFTSYIYAGYLKHVIQNMACIIGNVHYFVEPEIGNITGYEKKSVWDHSCRIFPM